MAMATTRQQPAFIAARYGVVAGDVISALGKLITRTAALATARYQSIGPPIDRRPVILGREGANGRGIQTADG
jgi:hypothetical protein